MKSLRYIYLLMVISFFIYGCEPAIPSTISTQTESRVLSPTVFPSAYGPLPTHTKTLTPTATLTLTPPIPLGSKEARATIQALLREPVDCAAPCFWGITPGRTTFGESENIFARLGLPMWHTTAEGKQFFGVKYDFLSLSVNLTVQESTVQNLRVKVTPDEQNIGISRKWQAYSPETLIHRYGQPSKVDLALDRGPNVAFAMIMYFDEYDLIVIYGGNQVVPRQAGSLEVCPLTAQFDMVWLWMGKDPFHPPSPHVPLERATGMTLEEFSRLMTGDPDKACFIVKAEEFLP